MRRVLEILVAHHDPRLVLLAAAICVFGAVTTMKVATQAAMSGNRRPLVLFLLLGFYSGATAWSTHFIANLAWRVEVPSTWQPVPTGMSFVIGAAVIGLGFSLAIRTSARIKYRVLGGMIVGLGSALLHFVGMEGMRMPGTLSHDPLLVLASTVLSAGFGALALAIGFGTRVQRDKTIAALLLAAMILGHHFVAMAGVTFEPGAAGGLAEDGVPRSMLVTTIVTMSVFILGTGLVGVSVDQRAAHRRAAEADRLRTLADGALEGIILHRGGVIVDANAVARRMFGLPEQGLDRPAEVSLYFLVAPPTPARDPADGGPAEVHLPRPDGSTFPAEINRRAIILPDGSEGEVFAVRDLTDWKEFEARIAHVALHDSLTDLPNRRFFMEIVQKTIWMAQRTGQRCALLSIDLDDFRLANELHGDGAGDEVLRAVARRIMATLRDADVAARLAGDEFAILITDARQPRPAIVLAERIIEALKQPIQTGVTEVTISASIGVALYPVDGTSPEELLRNADVAMARAKADGKGICRFFEPQMNAALAARRRIESGLRRAISEGRLTVAYQPIVDARSRATLGFESLARWWDPEMGEVTPAEFIPVAEETGLIVPIAEIILRQACHDAMKWPGHLRVAANLSAVQFRRPGLVDVVRRVLRESGLPGHRLELEITETLLVENREVAVRILRELKSLGVHISMDDFGTGYSSLSYLQSFPFDKIKIDRVFVSDLPENPQNASIVRAVAAMGRSLHMRVVAEGVETDTQAEMLTDLHCDEMQGFLIARPMPEAEVSKYLSRGMVTA